MSYHLYEWVMNESRPSRERVMSLTTHVMGHYESCHVHEQAVCMNESCHMDMTHYESGTWLVHINDMTHMAHHKSCHLHEWIICVNKSYHNDILIMRHVMTHVNYMNESCPMPFPWMGHDDSLWVKDRTCSYKWYDSFLQKRPMM